jgi:hypothetical protein
LFLFKEWSMLQLLARAPLFSREDTSNTPLKGLIPAGGIIATFVPLPIASSKLVAVIFLQI